MRGSLAGVAVFRTGSCRLVHIGKRVGRRLPFVANFVYFPGLRLAAFNAHIAAGVGRAAEADFVPCPRMRVIGRRAIADKQFPEVLDRHAFPNFPRCGRIAVVNGFQYLVLRVCIEINKTVFVMALRDRLKRFHGELVRIRSLGMFS